jgi:hypothetical protein
MAEKNGSAGRGHLLFLWSPDGYRLREVEGEAPPVGSELADDGHELVVTRIGPSPLPGDYRPCAYTTGKH